MPAQKLQTVALSSLKNTEDARLQTSLNNFFAELQEILFRENQAINIHTDGQFDLIQLSILATEPPTPKNGMIVYANGTTFNPGAGEGVYAREAGVWNKL